MRLLLHFARRSNFPILAIWLADVPLDIIPLLDRTATKYCNELFENYKQIRPDGVHVRISDLPISDSLRDLREQHLNQLVKVSGVVTRRGGVQPQLSEVSERSERALMKTSILAMNQHPRLGYRHLTLCIGYATSTTELTYSIPLNSFGTFFARRRRCTTALSAARWWVRSP